jgi:hypothetical protein
MIPSIQLCKRYSLSEIVKLSFYLVYTKLVISHARLVRFPIDIRGKKNIEFGKGFTAGYHCRLETYSSDKRKILQIGKNV